jgi:hypothetical protein
MKMGRYRLLWLLGVPIPDSTVDLGVRRPALSGRLRRFAGPMG